MEVAEIFYIAAAVITSLGGGAVLVVSLSGWLGNIWAKRMLQNERAKNEEVLEHVKSSLDLLKQKDFTRHGEKLAIYKSVINILSETIHDFELVSAGLKARLNEDTVTKFAESRVKAYGYLALISNQDVMDRFNAFIDYLVPVVYQKQTGSWIEMRRLADEMLNSMRIDLGIKDGTVYYRGER